MALQGLQNMYAPDMRIPDFSAQSLRLEDMMNQSNQMELQDQQRKLNYDTAADPMNLEKLSLSNQTSQAHLPGIQAESAMKQRKNKYEDIFNPEAINSIRGKYKTEELDRHINEMGDIGTLFQQGAEDVYNAPVGGAQRVKARLEAAGHGDMWNPEWEGLPPAQLQRALSESGSALADTVPKLRSSLLKEASAERIAAGNNATTLTAEEMRIEAGKYKKKVAQATTFEESYRKLKNAKDKYTALLDEAKMMEADEPSLAASYRSRAEEIRAVAEAELSAAGGGAIEYGPDGKPRIGTKGKNTDIRPKDNRPKQGTPENPIVLK